MHGDVSPDNILIFGELNDLCPRITDFGCSTLAASSSDRVLLATKEPWTAPEVHHRGLQTQEAMRSDIYSFSLLVLWILFHEELIAQEMASAPIDGNSAQHQATRYTAGLRSISRAKATGCLKQMAVDMVQNLNLASSSTLASLVEFFTKNLDSNVTFRSQSMETLLPELMISLDDEIWFADYSDAHKEAQLLDRADTGEDGGATTPLDDDDNDDDVFFDVSWPSLPIMGAS